jgi:hypothetical protein
LNQYCKGFDLNQKSEKENEKGNKEKNKRPGENKLAQP